MTGRIFRQHLRGNFSACLALLAVAAGLPLYTHAQAATLTISVPGPGTTLFLPIELVPLIGADIDEGMRLKIKYVGSGVLALNNLVNRNVDFAMSGMPAVLSMRSKGGKVVAIAAAGYLPQWALIVRADLKPRVKKVSDLKGLRVGLSSSTPSSRTTGQQFMEVLLKSEGMVLDDVRMISAGLSWEESSSILRAEGVDAILTDLSFASRLVEEGMAYSLINFGDTKGTKKIPGGQYLHATLITREDLIEQQPQQVQKMVSILRRALVWMKTHTPEQIVKQLQIKDEHERKALLSVLKSNPYLYSPDGRFSDVQLRDTEMFFRQANRDDPVAQSLDINSMIDERWVGVKP